MIGNIRTSKAPIISVVMSVYNTDKKFLSQAIESILNQTFSNFEFIIIDDGSNEETKKTIYSYKDKRIKVYENFQNIGLTKSLNIGISLAKGEYIARMDADDISLKNRLERQFKYMEEHSDVIALGSYARFMNSEKVGIHSERDTEILKMRMMFQNVGISHPTAFLRKWILDKNNIRYDERLKVAQDYGLWVNCLEYGKIVILPEVLVILRSHPGRISSYASEKQQFYAGETKKRQLRKFNRKFTKKEEEILCSMETANLISSSREYASFMNKLIAVNQKESVFDIKKFRNEVFFQWFQLVYKRIKRYKKLDLLFTGMTLKALLPINWIYLFKHTIVNRFLERKVIIKSMKELNY